MAYLKEQHICIKLCFILGKNATGTFEMLEVALGEQTWEEHVYYSGFTRYKDAKYLGCPLMSETDLNVK
jgi:hypothetical protein